MIRVVILAGGFGTRVQHLLPDLPKPMANVCGRPFIDWVVRYFQRYGLNDFVISTGFRGEVIERYFEQHAPEGARIRCCRETTPLGTAGGFLHCTLPHADEPAANADDIWIVTNGDSLVLADPRPLVRLVDEGYEAGLLGLRMADAARYGTLEVNASEELTAFLEKRPGAGVINVGVYAFRDSCVRSFPAQRPLSFELNVFPDLSHREVVAVESVEAPFLDIGTPETLRAAEAFISAHLDSFKPQPLSTP